MSCFTDTDVSLTVHTDRGTHIKELHFHSQIKYELKIQDFQSLITTKLSILKPCPLSECPHTHTDTYLHTWTNITFLNSVRFLIRK